MAAERRCRGTLFHLAVSLLVGMHAVVGFRAAAATFLQRGRPRTHLLLAATATSSGAPKKVVFLGTPDVAATSLQLLHAAAATAPSPYVIAAVVTQPPAPAGRNKKLTPSPVQVTAEQLGLPVLAPESAKDVDFLSALEALAPDLCVTAAYGNYLPKRFLATPARGTVNIHPSLLPRYRGAAPVQRCLENGDAMSGVTVLYTVTKMDAGPIIAQKEVTLTGDEKADAFLAAMFAEGTRLLVDALPAILDGSAATAAQDEALATAADKLSPLDARTDFAAASARQVHNKCRGLAVWPGLWSTFQVLTADPTAAEGAAPLGAREEEWAAVEAQRIKIITTAVLEDAPGAAAPTQTVTAAKQGRADVLRVVCGDGSVLGVLELQPPGKKVMAARDFLNGLRGRYAMRWTVPPLPPAQEPADAAKGA